MKQQITPKAYEALSDADQDWYAPVYAKYHVKKVRSYESCELGFDHFMGWVEESIPIGEPYQYEKVDNFTHMLNITRRWTQPAIIDSLNKSNVIMNRILSKPNKRNTNKPS